LERVPGWSGLGTLGSFGFCLLPGLPGADGRIATLVPRWYFELVRWDVLQTSSAGFNALALSQQKSVSKPRDLHHEILKYFELPRLLVCVWLRSLGQLAVAFYLGCVVPVVSDSDGGYRLGTVF
jgi:hypothetical protein